MFSNINFVILRNSEHQFSNIAIRFSPKYPQIVTSEKLDLINVYFDSQYLSLIFDEEYIL